MVLDRAWKWKWKKTDYGVKCKKIKSEWSSAHGKGGRRGKTMTGRV